MLVRDAGPTGGEGGRRPLGSQGTGLGYAGTRTGPGLGARSLDVGVWAETDGP
jgi:hypothetical protein